MVKKVLFLLSVAVFLANMVRADRYDDLIDKWEDHGITGYTSTDAMFLAWNVVPRLQALHYGYLVTNDPVYIDKAATAVDYWVTILPHKDPNGDYEYDISPGEAGRIIGAITMFIYLVKTNSNLSHHLTAANSYLAWMEANIIKTWLEKYYINDSKQDPVYHHYPGTGAPIYKCYDGDCPPDETASMEDMTAQHNKNSDFGLAIMWLWLATGNEKYKKVVEEIALNYKSKLYWSQWGRFYSWHYWDPSWAGDFASGECGIGIIKNSDRRWIEHRSGYGSINMEFVTECHRQGIVFSQTDIDRFVETNANIMYNPAGDWFLNDGSIPGSGEYGGLYQALCTYDTSEKLANLAFASWDVNYTGWGGLGLPYYVYTMQLPDTVKHPAVDPGYVGPVEAVKVESIDRGTVEITFVHEVTRESAENPANWKMSRGTEILSVSLGADNKTVTMKTVEQLADYGYHITCYDVYDNLGNKTFAYGNAQPWEFTSNAIPAGIGDVYRAAERGVAVSRVTSPVRERAEFIFGSLPDKDAGTVIITAAAGNEVGRVPVCKNKATWQVGGNKPGLYFYTVGTTGFTGSLLVVR